MNKKEYLSELQSELIENKVSDADEIIAEYANHFDFKISDGYSEEEIAAKLGTPEEIAAEFKAGDNAASQRSCGVGKKILSVFIALFEFIGFLLFGVWMLAITIFAIAAAGVGVCLLTQVNIFGVLPPVPYLSAVLFAVCFFAIAILVGCAAFYCLMYLKQLIKASLRWHRNILSKSKLPPLPINPQFGRKSRRKLRRVIHWSLAILGVGLVLAYIVSALQAGGFEFWHIWNWFVK